MEKQLREQEKTLADLKRADAGADRLRLAEQLQTALQADVLQQRQRQREEQAAGDGIYWPLFNLDIKNPNSLEALEHRPPEELIADMLAKERRVMGIMEEIGKELALRRPPPDVSLACPPNW